MKKHKHLIFLLAVFGLFACNQDETFIKGSPSMEITAEIPSYQYENSTRVSISKDLSTFTWNSGDQFGIYASNTQSEGNAAFKIKQGGGNSGEFSNDFFSLKPNTDYYAFYPFDHNATTDAYPVDFTGQVQTENGGTSHIGARNYMCAQVDNISDNNAHISFNNMGAVLQLVLPIEGTGTYTGLTLSTANTDFIAKGNLNMKTGSITSTSKSKEMKVSFGQGIVLNKGTNLTVNMLLAPVDLSGKMLSVALESASGIASFENFTGMNIKPGKAYKVICITEEKENIPYLTFSADAVQILQMSKEVATLEYSVNYDDWKTLGTDFVFFGGEYGNLRLRGKNNYGTASSQTNYSYITLGTDAKVSCSGDIRTLVDYENYQTASTSSARFCSLFTGCSSFLIKAPKLPATTLCTSCYASMFKGCTGLIEAPDLPATTLKSSCYESMFEDCSNLKFVPNLPATTLASTCYENMFTGCTSLEEVPDLAATTMAYNCCIYMFKGCTSLKKAPNLPATVLDQGCYGYMFDGCIGMVQAPELPATTLAKWCYEGMFSGCTNLSIVPERLPATKLEPYCYNSMFDGCLSLSMAPEISGLILAEGCCAKMFRDCTGLTNGPKRLPATRLESSCYESMFRDCTSLISAPQLPATILKERCYEDMFWGCSSLTVAPDLPAMTLADYCYRFMFADCRNLSYIKMMATNIDARYCLEHWTVGLPFTGTFVKNAAATWNVSGDSCIPSGWTVQTATN